MTAEHYFSAEPGSARPAGARSSSARPGGTTGWPSRPGCSRPAGWTRAPRYCCARRALPGPRRPRGRCWISAAGTGRSPRAGHRGAAATVYAVDVNSRACELTGENAAALGLADRVVAAAPDEVPAMSGSRRSGRTRRPRSARPSCTRCCCAGCPGWPRTASPGWWSAGTSAATRCTPGWSSRAGRSSGTPARRASGCCGCAGKPADRARPGPGRMLAMGYVDVAGVGLRAAGRPGAVRRRVVPGRRGRQGRAGRAERGRQDDAAADGRRRPAGARPARSRAPAGSA